jgi:formylglycine-generating enzyme required for sulfatase activity
VSDFWLDTFEVSVARFRAFVNAYESAQPAPGQGKNPNNLADPGWGQDWAAKLPATVEDLEALLQSPDCPGYTYTPAIGSNDSLPINCVTWPLAYAFCIWDGGRLPTEAEWNFAAAGGDLGRYYPWSDPPSSTFIDSTRAVYLPTTTSPEPVGTKTAGAGLFGQYDLAGNVFEWLLDVWYDCYQTTQCWDCASTQEGAQPTRVIRGGAYNFSAESLTVSTRMGLSEPAQAPEIGFRCARSP